ncbi:MAG: GMP synthase [Pseudomonadota bacterium]
MSTAGSSNDISKSSDQTDTEQAQPRAGQRRVVAPLRLGILRTDKVRASLSGRHGDYPAMFRHILQAVDDNLEIVDFDVQEAVPEYIDCDVYLITGSRHSVYDNLPWISPLVDFLQDVLRARKKIIGICFGHQLMAHYFGGRVGKSDRGWGVGVLSSQVTRPAEWMTDADGRSPEPATPIQLLYSHQDQVLELPPQAQVFLSSAFCPIGGYTLGDQVIAVQGHPEFSPAYAGDLMAQREALIGAEVFAEGMASLQLPVDAERVVGWLLQFARA